MLQTAPIDVWGPPLKQAANPDILEHPHLPLKMNSYQGDDYNLYWKDRRAGFVDRREGPDGNPHWEIHMALQHPDGTVCDLNAVAQSPQEAIEILREYTPRKKSVPMLPFRFMALSPR